jgi:tripartite-type tricarboxylate transporter receptor subunit TctC
LATDPDFREKILGNYHMTPIASSQPAFKAFVENEAAMWKKIIEERKLQID